MKDNSREEKQISRRGIFPLLGSTLLIPFLGFGNPVDNEIIGTEEEVYETLLKPDGTAVKVKVGILKKSKVLKKNISNKSLLNWLGRKL